MDQALLERMIRSGKLTPAEVLGQTPADRLDEAVAILKRCRPTRDVCQALMERIAKAPLEDFNLLKSVYFHHCVDRPGQGGAG
jgi:hypothetical protein